MNKQIYLEELNQLLQQAKIANRFAILSEYEIKIDNLLQKNNDFNQVIKQLGTPEDVLQQISGREITRSTPNLKYPNSDFLKIILIIFIIIMVLSSVIPLMFFGLNNIFGFSNHNFLFSLDFLPRMPFYFFGFGSLKFFLIIIVIIYFLKNKKK